MLNKLSVALRQIVQIDPLYSKLFLLALLYLVLLVISAINLGVEGFWGNVAAELVGFLLDVMFLCAAIFYYEASKASSRQKKLIKNIARLCHSSFPFGHFGKPAVERQYCQPARRAQSLLQPLLPVVIEISAGHYQVYSAILGELNSIVQTSEIDSASHSYKTLNKMLQIFETLDSSSQNSDASQEASRRLALLAWDACEEARTSEPTANSAITADAAR